MTRVRANTGRCLQRITKIATSPILQVTCRRQNTKLVVCCAAMITDVEAELLTGQGSFWSGSCHLKRRARVGNSGQYKVQVVRPVLYCTIPNQAQSPGYPLW